MHRLTSTFVLGYHGCKGSVAEKLLSREIAFDRSENGYDWLGDGIYFWLENPKRACEWAVRRATSDRDWIESNEKPAVVGAVIDLGLCLDLTTTVGIEQVRAGHRTLQALVERQNEKMPENTHPDGNGDKLVRRLDCAVINQIHQIRKSSRQQVIDTVKGVFSEGGPAYPGAAIRERTHVQLAVANPACIKGVFYVPAEELTGAAERCRQSEL